MATGRDSNTDGLDVYLVGGAVRDELLGREVTERDWVVTGATPEDMTARGFRPVGKDFPVFLHPETHEEYALARTERKTGRGYHGFSFHAAPDVTLEEDLARRDLTVNAMARHPDGTLVDPFKGYDDLQARRLRHVSAAFQEDPVRILRLARFTARYAPLGFAPADDTMDLCRRMVDDGEVDHLVPERVWQELDKALTEPRPSAFFGVLRGCGALARIMPEVDELFGNLRTTLNGEQIDAGDYAMKALDTGAAHDSDPQALLALTLQDLDAIHGAGAIAGLADRLRIPNAYRDLAQAAAAHLHSVHRARSLTAGEILGLLEHADAFRRPDRFHQLLRTAELDARASQVVVPETGYPPRLLLERCLHSTRPITGGEFARQGLKGPAIANAVREARQQTIEELLAES